MPIRSDLRHLYQGSLWEQARRAVKTRAKGRCEWCRKPDRTEVLKAPGGYWALPPRGVGRVTLEQVRAANWMGPDGTPALVPSWREVGVTFVICTAAHLNRDPENGHDPKTMAWLCQSCHLAYDRQQHRVAAARTVRAKRNNQELFP